MEASRRLALRRLAASGLVVLAAVGVGLWPPPLGAASLVQNPSFELNYPEEWPHYGAIAFWDSVGGGGVNEAGGPFHNAGTLVPDRDRVAFKQGAGALSQTIAGLEPGKRYWVQFFYDARACCGGTIAFIAVKWNGVSVDSIPKVVPAVGAPATYFFRSAPFVPESDSGTLTFDVAIDGDATAVFDAVTIVQRDEGNVVVANPSFEASGPPTADTGSPPAIHSGELFTEPDDLPPAGLAGWEASGRYGVSLAGGVYADNGAIPDQDLVAFIEGPGSLRQTVRGLTFGTTYDLSFRYNARSGTRPRLQVKVDGDAIFEEDVEPVGGAEPYRSKTVSFTAEDTSAVIEFAQAEETEEVLLLDDIRLAGQVVEDQPIDLSPTLAEIAPSERIEVQVTVPSAYLTTRAVDLEISIDRPDMAQIVDADVNGILTLSFPRGGPNVQSFEIEGVGNGKANLVLLNLDSYPGLVWRQSVSVEVVSSFVRNASFEGSPVPGGAGYGPILAWQGGSGLNAAAGPFADNGIIPDRAQVAFLQGAQTLSQEVFGLEPGANYWLQFRYNARAFGGTAIDLSVRFGGREIESIAGITAVGSEPGDVPYNFANIQFSPAGSSGLLEFVTSVAPGVDATLLLDAVNIVERSPDEVVIENPSFEASGSPIGVGYLGPIAGWTGANGINVGNPPLGPFADNGLAPDQDRVAFVQQNGRLSQFVTGLVPGAEYALSYAVNRRICCPSPTDPPQEPTLLHSVSFADLVLVDFEEVLPAGGPGELVPYLVKEVTFEAPASEGELAFATSVVGDASMLIDDVRIRPAAPREICDNGIDDDRDGDTDCADSDCADLEICKTPPGKKFVRADANGDGGINITDGIFVLNFLFLGGPPPPCEDAADSNDDGGINITDGIYILNFLFLGGPEPLPPYPGCGVDPEGDGDSVPCETAHPNC